MELMQAIAERKSTRAYTPAQVDADKLEKILLAGMAAPVGMSVYDKLHFSVVQDAALLEKVSAAASAARGSEGDAIYAAPTMVVISSAEMPDPNLAYVNAACIGENMALEATELGVGNVIIWAAAQGLTADAALAGAVGVPDGFKAILCLVFGMPADGGFTEKPLEHRIAINHA